MTDKITSPAPARADIGAEMANVMFNFAQRAGHTLTSDDAVLFDKLRKRWDAAPAQAPVAAEPKPVAWVDVTDTDEGPYEFHGVRLLPTGRHHLYMASQASAIAMDALHPIVAGALFDFAGYLTTRPVTTSFGSTADPAPAANLLKEWAALRGLGLGDAAVLAWQELLIAPQAPQPCQQCGAAGGHKLQCSYRPDGPVVLPAVRARAPQQATDPKWDGAEEWMPLAWALCAEECGEEACTELVWEGGPIKEPWGDRWLKYEDEAKRLIALVREHAPQAPQQAEPVYDRSVVARIATQMGWTPPAAVAADEECHCDRTGLGVRGVSCGDCPRDYSRPSRDVTEQAELTPEDIDRIAQQVQDGPQAGGYIVALARALIAEDRALRTPGMTQPKTEEPVRYCWSHDGEEYHDELPSREDAMHEALAALVTDGVGEPGDIWTVHTGVCRPAISILRSIAESIGSELVERLEEWLCDDITSDHPIIELPKGRHADLGNAVLDFMAQHAEFKRYGVGEEQEHEEEIPGDADSSVQVTGKEGDA